MPKNCLENIHKIPRQEYLEDVNFRVIQLLMRYHAMAELANEKIIKGLFDQECSKDMASDYMIMIRDGNIELTTTDIEAFCTIIANSFGYDPVSFCNLIKFEAMYYEPSDDPRTNLRRQTVAIGNISNELK